MQKKELIKELKTLTNVSQKDLTFIVDNLLELIKQNLENGEKVQLTNFGTFEIKMHKGRRIANPRTQKIMQTKDKKTVSFSASQSFKDELNEN